MQLGVISIKSRRGKVTTLPCNSNFKDQEAAKSARHTLVAPKDKQAKEQ